MGKDLLSKLLAGMVAALVAGVSYAGVIATRAELQALLGGAGTLETFEAFNVTQAQAVPMGCPVLNSAAVCDGQTNLVAPGVSFSFGTGGGQWNGKDYFGAPSREILAGAPAGQPLVIDFTGPVQAFGVDLRSFATFRAHAQIKVFDLNDGLLDVINEKILPETGAQIFVGWANDAGIGRVELRQIFPGQPSFDWSPIIDNLEFGNVRSAAVPEPTILSLLVLGLAGLIVRRLTKHAGA